MTITNNSSPASANYFYLCNSDIYNMQNLKDMQDLHNMQNLKDMQDLHNMQNLQNNIIILWF